MALVTVLATGQNSSICLEENCNNPVADMYLSSESIYSLCLEGTENMAFQKGYTPWNKGKHIAHSGCFKKGNVPWIKGKNHTEGSKKRQSDVKIGKHFSPATEIKTDQHISIETEFKKGHKLNLGRKYSDETVEKMSKSHIGQTAWNKGLKGLNNAWNKNLKGIHLSPETEFKQGHTLCIAENNPMWKGGSSFLPYCHKFNTKLKERIRERDNRTCQLCGIKENGRKLSIHHIHYDKVNCEPDLITLCVSCNSKVNTNRDFWENYFIEKLKERGLK